MAGKSEHEEGTEKYSVRLPPSVAKWYVVLGGTLAKGIVESHRMHTDGPFSEPLVDASPAFSDSARASTEGLEKLAERESAPVHYPAIRVTLTPQGMETRHDGVLQPEKQFNLPPIYQGGEDVTPRFKQEKGRKTGSVRADSQVSEFDETDGIQEDFDV